MKSTLKTITMSTILAVAFLSAGAFANSNGPVVMVQKTNVTVIHKNSSWPILVRRTTDPCAANRCIEV